jgi:poly(3-hydroxybutyrate) depolymerase
MHLGSGCKAIVLRPARWAAAGIAGRVLVCLLFAVQADAAERLPAFGADLGQTTVSGISSGGYMAVQFHVAHSALVRGVGALASGPYYCAQGSLRTAWYNCMKPSSWTPVPAPEVLKSQTDALARAEAIDATSHLASARVWLLSGSLDETVSPSLVEALRRYYAGYVDPTRIRYVGDIPAGHGMITNNFGGACAATASPYINDCDRDAAGELLQHLYGALKPAVAQEGGTLAQFDQREFFDGGAFRHSMADAGYVYLPRQCAQVSCRVHVVFHGCRQNSDAVGETFVRHAGYNRWADGNDLIILYPQTVARNGWGLSWNAGFIFNPRGCWDWWGYDSPSYHTKAGPQIKGVKAMVERLGQARR